MDGVQEEKAAEWEKRGCSGFNRGRRATTRVRLPVVR